MAPALKDYLEEPVDPTLDSGSISGGNAPFLEDMYQQWRQDKSSVDAQWQDYFASIEQNIQPVVKAPRPLAAPVAQNISAEPTLAPLSDISVWEDQNRVSQLIYAYRTYGHKWAHTNPMETEPIIGHDLTLAAFGLNDSHLDQVFATDGILPYDTATLRDIIKALKKTYVRTIGVQYRELPTGQARRWLRDKMEAIHNQPTYSKNRKLRIYDALHRAAAFENFIHTKYMGVKRFSLEGGDSLIPMLETMTEIAGFHSIEEIVFGMSHRGRLNVLTNIMRQPVEEIIAAFEQTLEKEDQSSGDVKYHFGRSEDITTRDGHKIHIALLNNPSHLEAVNPVVEGSARARQLRIGKDGINKVLPVLIHGDSAFSGQGIVPETLNLSQLEGYTTGGTVHIVVNNRLGYTAEPQETFSGEYCTDIARLLQVPIFHVNGDDPEACVHVMELAMAWRQQFKRDVVIDLVCYRKYGHNEGDDPTFTQPVAYKSIKTHKTPAQIYKEQILQADGSVSSQVTNLENGYVHELQSAYDIVKKKGIRVQPHVFQGVWEEFGSKLTHEPDTAISKPLLNAVADSMTAWPSNFVPHRKIAKLMEQRRNMLKGNEPLNWGAGEAAAYASLLSYGTNLRLTGQDVQRGTFSHRHIALVDNNSGERFIPLSTLASNGAKAEVHNSSLSELAVLGFEYGYSITDPNTLTIWEAQFGDFANGAQIIIDQFLSSSEMKWQRYSGLTMLLPHGYEGQGPEHSSARLERYLQLCAEENMTVANLTTPAQIFHILRRQMLRTIRRPLIIMTPKSLLRHPKAVSDASELTDGRFQEVIADKTLNSKTKVAVLCSGKLYYDLLAAREEQNRPDVALIRVEQLHPLPAEQIKEALKKLSKTAKVVWAQEEPRNQGSWFFMLDNLAPQLKQTLEYVGRPAAASTAVGSPKRHNAEQRKIIEDVFTK